MALTLTWVHQVRGRLAHWRRPPRRHLGRREYEALERIVAAAEAEGILVLPLNRFGCVVLCPRQGGGLRGMSLATPDEGFPLAPLVRTTQDE